MTSPTAGALAIITARGGSKGLPRKNVLPLAGRPLIAWSIAAALGCRHVGRVIVSTDDAEIAAVSRAAGAEVPFLRPAELASDTATSVDVLRHALAHCPGHETLVLLQPTSPLRTAADLDAAFARREALQAASCVSVCAVEESPWLMYGEDAQGRLQRLLPAPPRGTRRQDLPPAYRLNGAIYIADVAGFLRSGALVDEDTVPHVMPPERSVDIDTLADFERAAQWLAASAAAPT